MAATAWTCPVCNRLVPRSIDTCRCGTPRLAIDSPPLPKSGERPHPGGGLFNPRGFKIPERAQLWLKPLVPLVLSLAVGAAIFQYNEPQSEPAPQRGTGRGPNNDQQRLINETNRKIRDLAGDFEQQLADERDEREDLERQTQDRIDELEEQDRLRENERNELRDRAENERQRRIQVQRERDRAEAELIAVEAAVRAARARHRDHLFHAIVITHSTAS